MLEEFASMLHREFNRSVRGWIDESDILSRPYIKTDERKELSGQVWREIKSGEIQYGLGCPFPYKER